MERGGVGRTARSGEHLAAASDSDSTTRHAPQQPLAPTTTGRYRPVHSCRRQRSPEGITISRASAMSAAAVCVRPPSTPSESILRKASASALGAADIPAKERKTCATPLDRRQCALRVGPMLGRRWRLPAVCPSATLHISARFGKRSPQPSRREAGTTALDYGSASRRRAYASDQDWRHSHAPRAPPRSDRQPSTRTRPSRLNLVRECSASSRRGNIRRGRSRRLPFPPTSRQQHAPQHPFLSLCDAPRGAGTWRPQAQRQ